MKFIATLELELDVECSESGEVIAVELHGVDLLKALKRKQIAEIAEQALEATDEPKVS